MIEPLFHAPGVPDDEILLAEAIATAELAKRKPARYEMGLEHGVMGYEPKFREGCGECCIMGAMSVARGVLLPASELPGALTGNDSVDHLLRFQKPELYDLGVAFRESGEVNGSVDSSI